MPRRGRDPRDQHKPDVPKGRFKMSKDYNSAGKGAPPSHFNYRNQKIRFSFLPETETEAAESATADLAALMGQASDDLARKVLANVLKRFLTSTTSWEQDPTPENPTQHAPGHKPECECSKCAKARQLSSLFGKPTRKFSFDEDTKRFWTLEDVQQAEEELWRTVGSSSTLEKAELRDRLVGALRDLRVRVRNGEKVPYQWDTLTPPPRERRMPNFQDLYRARFIQPPPPPEEEDVFEPECFACGSQQEMETCPKCKDLFCVSCFKSHQSNCTGE